MIVRGQKADGTLSEIQIATLKHNLDNYRRRFKWVTLQRLQDDLTRGGGDSLILPITVYDCYIANNVELADIEFLHVIYCDETLRFFHTLYERIIAYDIMDSQYDGNKKKKCGSLKKKRKSAYKARKNRSQKNDRNLKNISQIGNVA